MLLRRSIWRCIRICNSAKRSAVGWALYLYIWAPWRGCPDSWRECPCFGVAFFGLWVYNRVRRNTAQRYFARKRRTYPYVILTQFSRLPQTVSYVPRGACRADPRIQTNYFQVGNRSIRPDPDTVVRLAHLFGISTDQLLTEAPEPLQPEVSPASAETPQSVKAPLLDTHVFGRYIFLAVTFLGGILLFGLWLLAARWEVWFVDWFDILISLLMILLMTVLPLVVAVQYMVSKCRAVHARRREQNGKNRRS